jgi:carbon storage regulator
MLVLTRRVGESIDIGSDIAITVCQIHENRVRLGITAPKSMRILRHELVIADIKNATTTKEPSDDGQPRD